MERNNYLQEVLEEVKDEVLSCSVVREGKESCIEKTCEFYFICKKLFDLEKQDK